MCLAIQNSRAGGTHSIASKRQNGRGGWGKVGWPPSDVVLSGVVALVFDGGTGAPKAEMADVTVLAAIGADQENIAEEKLHGTFSSGTENCRATAVGALCGSIKGQHGTVLFLAWSERVYTTPTKKVSACKSSEA